MIGNRLPVRWRVTAAFVGVLTLVLLAAGTFIFTRMSAELDRALERSLEVRSAEVALLVDRPGLPLSQPGLPTLEADEEVAQILTSDGTVVAASSFAGLTLVDSARLAAALRGPVHWDRPGDEVLDENLRLLAVPVTGKNGTFVVVVGSSLDERNQSLDALLAAEVVGLAVAVLAGGGAGYAIAGLALRPVREALQRERRFVAEASHQLRTPLTIITSEIELAQLAVGDQNAHAATLRSIGEEADRMARLADQLVLLAAADEQRLIGSREPVPVGDLLQAAAERHRPHAAALDRLINVRADPGLVVPADRARLEVAVDSLIENALQHGAGDIQLGGTAVNEQVVLSVRDRGPGFQAAVAAEAFERFRRGSRSSGSGLGLAIVQAVARAHGGKATIAPAAEGSTVSISLPQVSEVWEVAARSRRTRATGSARRPRRRTPAG